MINQSTKSKASKIEQKNKVKNLNKKSKTKTKKTKHKKQKMKKILTIIAVLSLSIATVFAQGFNPQSKLELDKNVRRGKLDNGLTYYIRHNAKPAQRAEFYIVTNVGAIQETPAQDGLAHFLEHMCLNGTKNFPGKGIISYMESIGAKFGENVNASTSVEVTQYMLNNIPVVREGIIDTSLLILRDYAAYVTNDPKEIENERGVIIEEKRTRNNSSWRLRTATLKALYKGSKYADCSIIGSQENLETFKPEELVSFYKTWYRPDMQAIIVVGDIDVDKIEGKIKNIFSELPKAENPKAKDVIKVPDNKEPIVSIFTDKELSSTSASIIYKFDPMPEEYNQMGIYLMQNVLKSMMLTMMNERLSDIAKKPNAPFLGASTGINSYCKTMDGFSAGVSSKDGEVLPALKALMTEIERAKRYGFTQAEFERVKANLLRAYEMNAENASGRYNSQWVGGYINNFTSNSPYLDPAYLNNQAKECINIITLEMVNTMFPKYIKDENRVILFSAPEREGLAVPTEKELLDVIESVKTADIEAPVNESFNEPLLDTTLLKGSKIKKESDGKFGTKIITLSNGIQIHIKSTDFKKDEVIMKAVCNGGYSVIPDELMPSLYGFSFDEIYLSNAGVSKFPKSKLTKMLTGKAVGVAPYIGGKSHGINASGSPKDFETMLQLMYLYYTDPRFEKSEFDVTFNQVKAILPNLEKRPDFIFQRVMDRITYEDTLRKPVPSSKLLEKVRIEDIEKGYKFLFNDAAGMKVFITGNVNIKEIEPLLEKYFGSLPIVSKKGKMWKKDRIGFKRGVINKEFDVEMQTPKTKVLYLFDGDMKKNMENDILMSGYTSILDMLFTKTIREDEGGTYGVGVQGGVSMYPKQEYYILFTFDTEYAKSKKLIDIALKGMSECAEKGVNEEYFNKAKENLIKAFPERLTNNSYWHSVIVSYYTNNYDVYSNYIDMVNKVMTLDKMKSFAKKVYDKNNQISIIMNPKEK